MIMKASRTELLGKALDAKVLEDQGYRGLLHNTEHGYMRYHTANGLQRVTKAGRQWRVKETILTSEDVDGFLREVGLLGTATSKSILQQLHDCIGGEMHEVFASGGGVIRTSDGLFIRYSPITGLDVVELSLTKWVRRIKILRSAQLIELIREGEWEKVGNVYRDHVRTHHRGSAGSSREAEGSEGEAQRVPEEAQRADEDGPRGSGEDEDRSPEVQPG